MTCVLKSRPVYLALLQRRACHSVVAKSPVVTQPLNFLDGQRVEPVNTDKQQQFTLQYPATGEILKTVQSSGTVDLDNAVTAARKGQKVWAGMSGFERGQVLKRAADICRSRQEELARAETLDTGKPIWEARFDIQGCSDSVEYYGGLASTISGEFLQLSQGNFAYTIREPLGVVGGIGAWNYPFQMATWKSAPALACGNAFVFKPSQMTPLTAVMLGEIYKEAGLPDGCYNVVQGEAETGQLLCNHPSVDKMTFTGSVPVGSKVMEACAKDIKHVTLELGGKSPLIIFEDSHLDNAVTGAMLANFLTQGQVCSNGTRVFVQKKILKQFLEKLVARTKKMKIGDPFAEDTTVGATISRQQADKVLSYIDIAKKEGATVLCGGEEVTPESKYSRGQFISPCVLSGCHDNMTVVKDEIFGSVMSVLEFDCEEEVIQRANNTCFGLAGGVFTRMTVKKANICPFDVSLKDKFQKIVASGRKQPQGEDEQPEADETEHVIDDVEMEMGEIDEPESLAMAPAKHQKKSKVMRVRWMEAETSELLKYAHEYLEKRKTPSRNVCKSFIASSKAAGGELHKRSADNILKKISAMNVKARKTDE